MSRLKFRLEAEATGSRARAGLLTTLHGEVKTPVFMPVGTQATVKSQTVESLEEVGSRVLLANTYHLLLRPGPEVFRKFGGIHRFMNWKGPVLTDSGGFQIFSLPHSRKMNEQGARFQSYVDGRMYLLSPESSIEMQKAIGSDIMMVLDQCIPSTSGYAEAEAAMHLTHRWAKRSLTARGESPQALFGIVQGACFHDLRQQSADFLTALPFDGFSIGGLAVGETREQREEFTEATAMLLPRDLPRYLMGVGTPIDLLEAVHRGVDLFDCILPTALAQRGTAFTFQGKLQLRRSAYKFDEDALDATCSCRTCLHYSKAYLHHLVKAEEVLGWQLLSQHNLTFYHRLMREIREAVIEDRFVEYYRSRREPLILTDGHLPGEVSAQKKGKVRRTRAVTNRLGDYEVFTQRDGFQSVRQISSGEVMHSVSEPMEEANRLYIQQPQLRPRLLSQNGTVIWDVGLGAAFNAMAAVQCFEETLADVADSQKIGTLSILSFENDLNSLRLAFSHRNLFKHLQHPSVSQLLETGKWEHPSGKMKWQLLEGDFLERLKSFEDQCAAHPDLVFYDPFSAKTDTQLWSLETFRRIYRICAERPMELITYSASTAVRAALLAAGFYVGVGVGTGPKTETTRASTRAATRDGALTPDLSLLNARWVERWRRSDARIPMGMSEEQQTQFERLILEHPQFRVNG